MDPSNQYHNLERQIKLYFSILEKQNNRLLDSIEELDRKLNLPLQELNRLQKEREKKTLTFFSI